MSKRARKIGKAIFGAFNLHGHSSSTSSTVTEQPQEEKKQQIALSEEISVRGSRAGKKNKKRQRTIAHSVYSSDMSDESLTPREPMAPSEGDSESGSSILSDAYTSSESSEFCEELDEKVREEVEKDIPPSITDLSLAEKLTVKRVLMIWNPYAGNKRGKKVARTAKRMMEREGVVVKSIRLTHKGHAEEICEKYDFDVVSDSEESEASEDELSSDGIDILAAVGGDGTFHECVNGMLKRLQTGKRRAIPLAMIAAGTGNSFMRELHVKNLSNAVYHIIRGVHYPIDVCKVSFGDGDSCYAFNSLHWGLASKVNVRAEKLRWMGSAIRYTTAAFWELMRGTTTRAKITVVDEEGQTREFDDEFCLAIANNIITAAKGMKMAPEAKLDDGLIDLLLVRSAATLDLVQIFRKTYDGTHTDLPYVDYMKVRSFSIAPYNIVHTDGEPEEVQIEEIIDVDGELKGITPFSVEVLPRTLRVIL